MTVDDSRAVNTVVDVSLAVLFVGIAVTALTAIPLEKTHEYDPHRADYTADTVGASTLNVSYSIEAASQGPFDHERVSHGSMASQIGDAAVANAKFEATRLTNAQAVYETALDERVQAALVESSFRTNVTARWEPFSDAPVSGRATVGQSPPATADVSASKMVAPSGMEPVRGRAMEAVEEGNGYETVATLLAESVIEGYFPPVDAKHALERDGIERSLTRTRYRRMATAIDGVDPDDTALESNLEQSSVDTERINEYLVDHLASQFEAELAANFDSPATAARAITVGEVTVTVRTWEA